jgi:hypothetical protein
MRTPHDDLRGNISDLIFIEMDDGTIPEKYTKPTADRLTGQVLELVWEYVKDHRIDSNGRLIFEYGMLKHLLKGPNDDTELATPLQKGAKEETQTTSTQTSESETTGDEEEVPEGGADSHRQLLSSESGEPFCQRAKWMEAREAWIAGDRERAKEIEKEIFLHMNPWSWVKDKVERAEEEVYGSTRSIDF